MTLADLPPFCAAVSSTLFAYWLGRRQALAEAERAFVRLQALREDPPTTKREAPRPGSVDKGAS
jgi:hypothetical protein